MQFMSKTKFAFLGMALMALGMQAQEKENLMVTNGLKYLDVPYVAHTLEVNETEDLVINCDEVDCTTFVEYVLAESLTPIVDGVVSEGAFADNVIKIRYRNATIDGYTSRLHYIAEWAENGVKNGFLEDVTNDQSTPLNTTRSGFCVNQILNLSSCDVSHASWPKSRKDIVVQN